ncbi:ATP-grasp fold amidoligase family protein [Thauera mechernichensis]|uniref:ATP-grasp fold amidoligase family protein n=1 Tax=Thauera mechernichensis TaxID=82788 RepID=A0ABW3WA44_9RHOO|nr:ATP-grasp fold amidoligase family protein [Thauera mechernichensis]MDG3063491.1 ATP-grasp fold amidoligase family protein [Thauera mechernichensis]
MSELKADLKRLYVDVIKGLPLPYRVRMSIDHLIRQKSWPDLDNPNLYSEKMLWRLIFDRREAIAFTCDKLKMKEFAASKVPSIRVPKNIWVGFEPDQIGGLLDLPSECLDKGWALKPNHSSGFCLVGKGVPDLTSAPLSDWWRTYGAIGTAGWGGWAYSRAQKAILLEELVGSGTSDLTDYKFYVFEGNCPLLQVITGRRGIKRRYILDRNWVLQYSAEDPDGSHLPARPKRFVEMLGVAEKLGEDFDFMRIDLYYEDDEIWFSELTPYPSMMRSSRDASVNKMLGAHWRLPCLS